MISLLRQCLDCINIIYEILHLDVFHVSYLPIRYITFRCTRSKQSIRCPKFDLEFQNSNCLFFVIENASIFGHQWILLSKVNKKRITHYEFVGVKKYKHFHLKKKQAFEQLLLCNFISSSGQPVYFYSVRIVKCL